MPLMLPLDLLKSWTFETKLIQRTYTIFLISVSEGNIFPSSLAELCVNTQYTDRLMLFNRISSKAFLCQLDEKLINFFVKARYPLTGNQIYICPAREHGRSVKCQIFGEHCSIYNSRSFFLFR